MAKVAVSCYGGNSDDLVTKAFTKAGSTLICASYKNMMDDFSYTEFDTLYNTEDGREILFAHAQQKALEILEDADVLALPGNSGMIDPLFFNKPRQSYEFYSLSRTIAELALIHVAAEKGMPIYGVCGGHQVVAVYFGGELAYLDDNKQKKSHGNGIIYLEEKSMLYRTMNGASLSEITKSDPGLNGTTISFGGKNQIQTHW